jgi:hypothetical protein
MAQFHFYLLDRTRLIHLDYHLAGLVLELILFLSYAANTSGTTKADTRSTPQCYPDDAINLQLLQSGDNLPTTVLLLPL